MARPKAWLATEGAALVEFVLVLPLLLGLAFGVWEFGRLFVAQMIATTAAREGASYAARQLTSDPAQVAAYVAEILATGYGPRLGRDLEVQTTAISVVFLDDRGQPATRPVAGGQVQVTVPVRARPLTPLLSSPLILTGQVSQRLP